MSEWRARLGAVRKASAADVLLGVLPGAPVVTVESAAALIGRSTVATGAAVNRLAKVGILTQRDLGRRRYRDAGSSSYASAWARGLTNNLAQSSARRTPSSSRTAGPRS